MRTLVTSLAASVLALVASHQVALACEGHEDKHAQMSMQPEGPKKVSVDELAALLASTNRAKPTIYDVNTDETRKEKGIIPTAVLLPSSQDYDLALLPKTKESPVVFYCAAEKCNASKKAAMRAIEAGYTDVSVLPGGIAGWVKAGKQVNKQPVG